MSKHHNLVEQLHLKARLKLLQAISNLEFDVLPDANTLRAFKPLAEALKILGQQGENIKTKEELVQALQNLTLEFIEAEDTQLKTPDE